MGAGFLRAPGVRGARASVGCGRGRLAAERVFTARRRPGVGSPKARARAASMPLVERKPVGKVQKVVGWTVGLALIGVGLVGTVLPVLQGWLFILLGLAVLSRHSRWARALYRRCRALGRAVRDRVARRRGRRRDTRPGGRG